MRGLRSTYQWYLERESKSEVGIGVPGFVKLGGILFPRDYNHDYGCDVSILE